MPRSSPTTFRIKGLTSPLASSTSPTTIHYLDGRHGAHLVQQRGQDIESDRLHAGRVSFRVPGRIVVLIVPVNRRLFLRIGRCYWLRRRLGLRGIDLFLDRGYGPSRL